MVCAAIQFTRFITRSVEAVVIDHFKVFLVVHLSLNLLPLAAAKLFFSGCQCLLPTRGSLFYLLGQVQNRIILD